MFNHFTVLQTTVLLTGFLSTAIAGDDDYKLGLDSRPQTGVPEGKVTEHTFTSNSVFPGTHRRYWLYMPDQLEKSKPAALMVFQDGHAYVDRQGQFRVPVVFDNLIARGEMPVTIGLFIDPGTHGELPVKAGWQPTPDNRSLEYDSLSDAYARFLLEELVPFRTK